MREPRRGAVRKEPDTVIDPTSDRTDGRWERVETLFHAALDCAEADRTAFLDRECGDDLELRDAVAGLLEEDARGPSLLDRGVAMAADDVLGGEGQMPDDRTFGPYRVVRRLGEGGMGVVFLAQREDLGATAAVKVLRDAWLSPARRARFTLEQRTLAQLNHPSIARLFDAGTLADGTPWIVMEYVEGVPLLDYCRAHTRSVADRLRVFRQICDAVQYAHRNLIIHRDLKPSNILVRNDGVVKLVDFGIAKQIASLDMPVERTSTSLRLMTPAYAAPEQVTGDAIGIHTDIYGLGVVLYELLTGRLPFEIAGRTSGEVERLILQQDPERPSVTARRESAPWSSGVGKSAWADLDVLCLTAMHKDPSRRYSTAEALIRDVDHFLTGAPLDARPDSVGYRTGKFVRRHWRPLTAAAAVLVVVIGLVTFYTVRLTIARNTAVTEAARTQRIQRFMLNLFSGGDESAGPADELRVVTLLDRGVQEARSLDAEPMVQAQLYQTLGSMYQKLGKLDRADPLLRSALEQRRRLLGNDNQDVAESLVALGRLREAQATFDEAERLVREALEKDTALLGPRHPSVARDTTALGQILESRGAYDKAIPVLEQAVALNSQTGSDPLDLAASLSELANTQFYVGHYDVSGTLNNRVIGIYRQVYGDKHPLIADALINLGAIEQERGRFVPAEQFHRQALDIYRSWYGPDHPETASALTMVARALVQQNKLDEAGALMRDALGIQEHVYGPVHPRVASALNEVGNIQLRQGRLDEAEATFKRLVAVYREVYHDKHYYIGIALSNLASVYQERKQYASAENALSRRVAPLRRDTPQ
jgi:serine/threonine-protein kinase